MRLILILILFIKFCTSANIFCYFITASISHQVVYQPIWRELSLRGHNVTVVTTDPLNDPSLINLTEIDVNSSYKAHEDGNTSYLFDNVMYPDILWKIVHLKLFPLAFEYQTRHPKLQEILKRSDLKFDLVFTEMIWPPVYAFAEKFGCPMVGILSLINTPLSDIPVGNPRHPVVYPDGFLGYGGELNIWERLESIYVSMRFYLRYKYEIMPKLDKIARSYFGNDIPYLEDIEKNVSILLNIHNSIISDPKPTVPSLIHIGNTHIKKNTSLPKDLKDVLDKETKGIIYFSLGSNVKSCDAPQGLKNVLISAFSELPYKVLWKWETDILPGKPENVIIKKWFPQEGVLAHPNVKLFITQCGIQSVEEAIYYKTPMIGLPFYADQNLNAEKFAKMGIGMQFDYNKITKEQLKSSILEIIQNERYYETISSAADLAWDQPMNGLDTAIWWIEYVLRHKGAKHLRSPFLNLPLYQYFFLDVIAFMAFNLLLLSILTYLMYKFIKFLLSRKTKSKLKQK